MEETDFKFEPIWTSVLTLLEVWMIYFICKSEIAPESRIDIVGLMIFAVLPLFLGSVILPMTYKLLTGIPAIQLTADSLVDNIFGIEIDWSNVQNLYIQGIKKPFLAIDLKDKDKFYAGISNPFKRLLLRLMFAISPGDMSINLAFVSGANESVLAMSQVYWNRFYGNYE